MYVTKLNEALRPSVIDADYPTYSHIALDRT
jgi:hypothetical protein